jgi:hypothetical protein
MSESNQVYKHYLHDLGFLIRDLSIQATKEQDAAVGSSDREYAVGYLMGLHRVVSLMQQQAEAFQIPLSDLNLAGLDPETDLL